MKRILVIAILLNCICLSAQTINTGVFNRGETYYYDLGDKSPRWIMESITTTQNGSQLTISFKAVYRNDNGVPPYYHTITIDLGRATIVNGSWRQSWDSYGIQKYSQIGDASRIKISGDIRDHLVIPQYNTDKTNTENAIYIFCSTTAEGERLTKRLLSCQNGYKEPEPQYKESSSKETDIPFTSASSSVLFDRIKNYFEKYEVKSEVGAYSRDTQTTNLRVSFRYPNLIISFQDSYANNISFSSSVGREKLGKKELLVPIASTTISANGGVLIFESDSGLEHSINAKKNLVKRYGFYASPLVVSDLHIAICQFFRAVEQEGFRGTYGVSARSSNSSGRSSEKKTESEKTISNKYGL